MVARDGQPLSVSTTPEAVEELIHRALGPDWASAGCVREWVDGGDPGAVAARHGLLLSGLEQLVRTVRLVGARTPLPPPVQTELSTVGLEMEQHRRVRRLFGVRAPRGYLPMRLSRSTDVALRVLAALGPLPIEVLVEAVNRSRQPTAALPAMTASELENGLRFRDAIYDPDASTWAAPKVVAAGERDVALVAAVRAAGPLTRVQLHQVLLQVGYAARTPQSPIVDRNPLIRRTAPNRYELCGG